MDELTAEQFLQLLIEDEELADIVAELVNSAEPQDREVLAADALALAEELSQSIEISDDEDGRFYH